MAAQGERRRATLKAVAERVGVNPATVSATLNDAPRAKNYSEETKERIRAAARELGYVPNPLARTLKSADPKLIGVLLLVQDNRYFGHLLEGAERYTRTAGYELVTASLNYDMNRFVESLYRLAAWRVDGLLVVVPKQLVSAEHREALEKLGLPYLTEIESEEDRHDGGGFDYHGGRQAATHLWALGHRRIGVIGARPENRPAAERVRGMEAAVAEHHGDTAVLRLVRADNRYVGVHAGFHYARMLFEAHPDTTAILCLNDVLAIGAMRWLREQGREVPRDVSIVGFDDLCLDTTLREENRLGAYLSPPPTTVRTPLREMGEEAARRLLLLADPGHDHAVGARGFHPLLIRRSSTGPM